MSTSKLFIQKNTEAEEREDQNTGETKKGKKLKIKEEKKEDDPDYRFGDFRDEIMDVEKMRKKSK